MNTLHNFATTMRCQYNLIFPSVAKIMEHLLFVVGNGMPFDADSGMFEVQESGLLIHKYPELTGEKKDEFIKKCTERASRLNLPAVDYSAITVSDADFTEEAFYNAILASETYWKESKYEIYYRPYPLSEEYSGIFKLNENTPVWFLEIAINLCNAWERFLTSAIDNKNFNNEADSCEYESLEMTVSIRDRIVKARQQTKDLLNVK